jgi:pimeloyl-ACP methyl ester carboxylesterase
MGEADADGPVILLHGFPSSSRMDEPPLTRLAERCRRDVPDAEIHVLDAGHFALDEAPDEVAALTRRFLAARGI